MDTSIAQGTLLEKSDESIVLGLPHTDYQIHLLASPSPDSDVKKPIAGRICARAMRVDIAKAGGRFIEPVYGRPRRLQGRIIATDAAANTITVKAACPIVCELTANQQAGEMPIGAIATFDVQSGATFKPITQES
jgi:hypothetical protein